MGMFDSVRFKCPNCGGEVEAQSKAGECVLADIDPSAVPIAIAASIDGTYESCRECGDTFRVESIFPIKTLPMRLV